MSKKNRKPADQAKASPRSGVEPPPEHRFKPGQSGNPAGRKSAGATIREWWNVLAEQEQTEERGLSTYGTMVVPVAW